jgi:N-acyl-phosphatidylethanolamine-hydrolysing phospholipase D
MTRPGRRGVLEWFRTKGSSAPSSASHVDRAPPHHDPNGGFRNPWPAAPREPGGFWRWQRERRGKQLAPNPSPDELPRREPRIAHPRAAANEVHITCVGHATFLIQIGGLNLLTDPQWSRRASPFQFAGPLRFTPPGIAWSELPAIDAVLISHNHYDHLDDGTVRRLRRPAGDAVRWFTPLAYRSWFRRRGVRNLIELDWWQEATLDAPDGPLRVAALPCQHWTSRTPWDGRRQLWAAWAVITPEGRSVLFIGDTGYFPALHEIPERLGTFDALLLPIGAYEPRWFMRPAHMNPEEAVQAYQDLGGQGTMIGTHWGTWRLTDEDPLEPPNRTRAAWAAAGLRPERLWIPAHGETRMVARREEG